MRTGIVIAIAGSLLAMLLAFANVGMYLIWQPNRAYLAFVLLMAIAAGVGALPGMMFGWLTGKPSGKGQPPS